MDDEFLIPVAKRQRIEAEPDIESPSSRLFAPFRTIGLVSPTPVPFTAVPLGKTTFQITTSVGRSLQTYDLRRGLNLVFLSRPQCPEQITATCAHRNTVITAWGGGQVRSTRGVWIMKRGRVIGQLDIRNTTDQQIDGLIVFGSWIVGCGPKSIEIWRSETYDHYTTIASPGGVESQRGFAGVICNLPTFLNKIVVSKQNGTAEIYNISTGKLVHEISPPPSYGSGRITALTPAPAVALLAVAYADGSISIIDVEYDEVVLRFKQPSSNAVTSIAFRTDGAGAGHDGRQQGVMATSCINNGDITLWDLTEGGKLAGVLRAAHNISERIKSSGINKIEFLPGQPVLISSGLDNSLRSWVFDQNPFSPVPRPLHSRCGHAGAVISLRFLPGASDGSEAAGKWLMSAAQDRSLWGFSLRRDGQSTELSQGQVKAKSKKLTNRDPARANVEDLRAAPIVSMACSLNRDGGMGAVGGPIWTNPKATNAEEASTTGWESVVTAHEGDRFARTWFWGRKKAGRWAFESGDRKPVTSVGITACGTFALVGSAGGSLDMFNLQSGIHRQRFPARLTPSQAKQLKVSQTRPDEFMAFPTGHENAITGVAVDNLNQTVLSTGSDGTIIFWDFATGALVHKMSLTGTTVTALRYNTVAGLAAMAFDDLCIRIVDVETRRIVRELWGCVGQIYDHCFSHDGRWIVASSMDSVIRVFDLATGHLIDAFKTATCTQVAFSSTGEFLATAHAGAIGINIWNNKSLFAQIPLRQVDEEKGVVDLTSSSNFDAVSQIAVQDMVEDTVDTILPSDSSTVDQLDAALLTLSLQPRSRWQTLLNLDTIRERNKPIAPPEKPKVAPFFLGSTTLHDSQPPSGDFNPLPVTSSNATTTPDEASRISRLRSIVPTMSQITSILTELESTHDPTALILHLSSLPPSAADLELRTLTLSELPTFIRGLTARLRQRRDFELVNTWISVLLRVHGEFVSEVDDVRGAVLEFRDVMNGESTRLGELVGAVRGTVGFLRSAR